MEHAVTKFGSARPTVLLVLVHHRCHYHRRHRFLLPHGSSVENSVKQDCTIVLSHVGRKRVNVEADWLESGIKHQMDASALPLSFPPPAPNTLPQLEVVREQHTLIEDNTRTYENTVSITIYACLCFSTNYRLGKKRGQKRQMTLSACL